MKIWKVQENLKNAQIHFNLDGLQIVQQSAVKFVLALSMLVTFDGANSPHDVNWQPINMSISNQSKQIHLK